MEAISLPVFFLGLRAFPTSLSALESRLAMSFQIGSRAKARVVHRWATYRWQSASRASS
jgi:hypothetical protein